MANFNLDGLWVSGLEHRGFTYDRKKTTMVLRKVNTLTASFGVPHER